MEDSFLENCAPSVSKGTPVPPWLSHSPLQDDSGGSYYNGEDESTLYSAVESIAFEANDPDFSPCVDTLGMNDLLPNLVMSFPFSQPQPSTLTLPNAFQTQPEANRRAMDELDLDLKSKSNASKKVDFELLDQVATPVTPLMAKGKTIGKLVSTLKQPETSNNFLQELPEGESEGQISVSSYQQMFSMVANVSENYYSATDSSFLQGLSEIDSEGTLSVAGLSCAGLSIDNPPRYIHTTKVYPPTTTFPVDKNVEFASLPLQTLTKKISPKLTDSPKHQLSKKISPKISDHSPKCQLSKRVSPKIFDEKDQAKKESPKTNPKSSKPTTKRLASWRNLGRTSSKLNKSNESSTAATRRLENQVELRTEVPIKDVRQPLKSNPDSFFRSNNSVKEVVARESQVAQSEMKKILRLEKNRLVSMRWRQTQKIKATTLEAENLELKRKNGELEDKCNRLERKVKELEALLEKTHV